MNERAPAPASRTMPPLAASSSATERRAPEDCIKCGTWKGGTWNKSGSYRFFLIPHPSSLIPHPCSRADPALLIGDRLGYRLHEVTHLLQQHLPHSRRRALAVGGTRARRQEFQVGLELLVG